MKTLCYEHKTCHGLSLKRSPNDGWDSWEVGSELWECHSADGCPIQTNSIPFCPSRWTALQWKRGARGKVSGLEQRRESGHSKISNYHNCQNLFRTLFSSFSVTKSCLPTCTASPPKSSYKSPDCSSQDREWKSTLKICKSKCLGRGALTSVSRIAALFLVLHVCVCLSLWGVWWLP